jgi:hypothetical protein
MRQHDKSFYSRWVNNDQNSILSYRGMMGNTTRLG